MAEKDILQGWREIEEYLGLTRKTINRRGYPVRTKSGLGTGGAVYAVRQELIDHAKNGRIVGK